MEQTKKNRILISGAYGFIGYHLTKFLLSKGYQVVSFGNTNLATERLFQDLKIVFKDNLQMYGKEITDTDGDVMVHLAASKSTSLTRDFDGNELLLNNISIDSDLMREFEIYQEKDPQRKLKFIYMSTAEVYGENFLRGSYLDEYSSCAVYPQNSYAYPISKICGEAFLNTGSWSFDWNIIRLQNPYGPLMGDKTLPVKLITAALNGEKIFRLDNPNDTRPYIYVSDVAEAVERVIHHGVNHRTYNLCGTKEIGIKALLQWFSDKYTGGSLKIDYDIDSLIYKGTHRHLDMARFNSEVGLKQFVSIEEGIDKTYDFYAKNLAVAKSMLSMGI